MKKWDDSFDPMSRTQKHSVWDDDEEMLETVEPKKGKTFETDDIVVLNYNAVAGNFSQSRCLRVRIPLDKVVGIRLMSKTGEPETDRGVVLILELSRPLVEESNAFASRKVNAKYRKENAFAVVEDWTPNKVASRSSRIYLYGYLEELKQAAGLMATLCPHLATMLSTSTSESNSLKTSVTVEYASAPDFSNDGPDAQHCDKKQKVDSDTSKGYKMSVDAVHQLLVDTELVKSMGGARNVNLCLKKAILMGHMKIDTSTTLKTVIHKGKCNYCNGDIECTIGDALDQSTYAGLDYEDGGENANLQYANCETGNYITEFCTENTCFDSEKFHNDCCECEDIGVCLRDYRTAHCRYCGDHCFQGLSGFPCPSRGVAKCKKLAMLPTPSLSAWDGILENAEKAFEARLEGKSGLRELWPEPWSWEAEPKVYFFRWG